MESKNRLSLSDEVVNYTVKSDIVLTEDYQKLLELKKTVDLLVKHHLQEIKDRTDEYDDKNIGQYIVETKYGKNMFNKELANAWLEKNMLTERFSITRPEYIVPEVTEVDFTAVQKELKTRYKDSYNNDFCVKKEQGITITRK